MRGFILVTFLSLFSIQVSAQSTGCLFETIQTAGSDDAFVLPADSVHRSPGLASYLSSRNPKDYDDLTIDRHFGDSFKLDACLICEQVCSAKLEIELQGTGGLDCNDSIFVGQAGGLPVYSDSIYPGGCEFAPGNDDMYTQWKRSVVATSVRTIDLDVKALQDLVCDLNYPWLDVIVQDDHAVDSLRLIIQH